MSRLKRKSWSLAAAAVGTVALAATLAPPPAAYAAADVLVIGKAQDPRTLDPAITMSNNAWSVTYPAYERLVRYRVEGGVGTTNVEGELAASWTVTDDGLVWTFELVPGHKFDDGSPVDAAAVRFSFDRLMEMGQGPSEAFPTIEKTEAVDADTVRFTLNAPFPPFLFTLANNGAAIVNPKVMQHEKDGDMAQAWLSEHTAGSGAFRVTSWEKGQSIVMEPNPHYAGTAPALKKVVIRLIKEASARRLQVEKGDLDIAEHIPLDQLEALKGKPGIRIEDNPSFSVAYLYMNNKRPPLDDARVRQAISYAIDYQGIIYGILRGQGVQMRGPVPMGMWSHDPSAHQYSRDLAKAKALLKEAGVSDLKLGYLYAQRDPNWEPIGLAVQSNLSDIGITVEMQNFAYATMRDKLNRGEFDIAVGGWTPDFSDPYMFMNYWFDSKRHGLPGNRSFYTNAKVDELIREGARVTDQGERTRLYQEAQKIIIDDAVYVYLFQENNRFALRDSVKGYVYNPMLLDIYNIGTMSKSQ
jgi:peptide/nickel transport system substrate-binding protein